MSNPADSATLSPFMFGGAFFASAVTIQRRIADSMLAAFDALADAMVDSLRASAELADQVSRAQTPAEAAGAGYAWLQGRAAWSLGWLRAWAERPTPDAPAPRMETALPVPTARAPTVPQEDIRMPTKPPAGKVRPAPIVMAKPAKSIMVTRAAKKPARPAAK